MEPRNPLTQTPVASAIALIMSQLDRPMRHRLVSNAARLDRGAALPCAERPKGKRAKRRARGKAKAMRREVAGYFQSRNL